MTFIPMYSDYKIGIAQMSDFDTTTWTSVATAQLPCSYALIDMDGQSRMPQRANGKRWPYAPDVWKDQKGSVPKLKTGMPATIATLDLILAGVMQRAVVEGAATPYVKNFRVPSLTGASWAAGKFPDFAADDGYYYLLVLEDQCQFGVDDALLSAVPSRVTLSCYPDQNDGLLWMEVDWIARYAQLGQTYSGGIVSYSDANASMFNFQDISLFTIMSAALSKAYGFTLTIESGLTPQPSGFTGAYGCTNYSMRGPKISGSIDLLMQISTGDVSYSIRTKSYSHAPTTAAVNQIGWGASPTTVSETGELLINWQCVWGQPTQKGSDERILTCPFEGIESTSTVGDILQIDYANGIDRTWTGV